MKIKTKKLEVKTDERGWFVEILRGDEIPKKEFGQIYLTTAKPGVVKGNHYHTRKTDWFCVVKGKGELVLKNNKTGKIKKIIMGEGNLVTVKIPPNITHAIKNIGKKMLYLLGYIDEPYNPEDPDTVFNQIL